MLPQEFQEHLVKISTAMVEVPFWCSQKVCSGTPQNLASLRLAKLQKASMPLMCRCY